MANIYVSEQAAPGRPFVPGEHDATYNLCCDIQECLTEWGNDPAYKNAAQKLKEVERELDVLTASAGQRAAMRSMAPAQSGQERMEEDGTS